MISPVRVQSHVRQGETDHKAVRENGPEYRAQNNKAPWFESEPGARLPPCPGSPFRLNLFSMMLTLSDKPKKRGRPATGRDPMIGLRVPSDFTAALDAAAAAQKDAPSRSELIRRIVTDWLKRREFL